MVTNLNIAKKFVSDMPYFAFKLCTNIVVPNYEEFYRKGSKRGVEFSILRILKKDSLIRESYPSSLP